MFSLMFYSLGLKISSFVYCLTTSVHVLYYRACLGIIPHAKFTFAKIWIMAAQFEIRQKDLKAARTILGNAIGRAPKDKVLV